VDGTYGNHYDGAQCMVPDEPAKVDTVTNAEIKCFMFYVLRQRTFRKRMPDGNSTMQAVVGSVKKTLGLIYS